MIRNIIPSFFTSLNLISGCIAVYFVFSSKFEITFYFLLLGILFDFFDGFFARILDSETDFGVQLDSMADVITSGFLPGVILSQIFILNGNSSTVIDLSFFVDEKIEFTPLSLCGFILTLAAVNRLAKFNLESKDNNHKDFRGLPAPAMAIFFGSFPLLTKSPSFLFLKPILLSNITLIFLAIFFSFLMNSNFKFFSIKSLKGNTLDKIFKIGIVLIGIVLIFIFGLAGFTVTIASYIFLNLIKNILDIKKEVRD
ncbi:MAG: CDP-alcohol phosphatidyltransferase family protein [Flavobacteriaceae bacterium]|jgi:CDP-diacylglycerol---serine O-phosphatidyltransferase|nr:CDP-alcohol phosphatidyltransferase family protein [Flavobacteriaceae bacterium]